MDIDIKFSEWLTIASIAGYKLEQYTRPAFVGHKRTPSDFNLMTIGQLIELSDISDDDGSMYKVVEVTLGLTRDEIANSRAVDVVRYVGWAVTEVQRINKLFESLTPQATAKEKQAGIDTLHFGLFGMLDWYALRMGITNHDEVLQVPWMRIYKCMEMDNLRHAYERRYSKITSEEVRTKHDRR